MKASELIKKLQILSQDNPDIEVEIDNFEEYVSLSAIGIRNTEVILKNTEISYPEERIFLL